MFCPFKKHLSVNHNTCNNLMFYKCFSITLKLKFLWSFFSSCPSLSLDDSSDNLQHPLSSRRRTSCREDLHSHFINIVDPWPRRTFPLSETEFSMLKTNTSNCEPIHKVTRPRIELMGKVIVGGSTSLDERGDSSVNRSSSVGDDPNDPEWVDGSSSSSMKKNRLRRIVDDDPNDPEWNGSDHRKKGKNKR